MQRPYEKICDAVNYNLSLDVQFFSAQCTPTKQGATQMTQNEEIRFRCTKEQYGTIKAKAEKLGLSISAYVRMVALEAAS